MSNDLNLYPVEIGVFEHDHRILAAELETGLGKTPASG